MKNQSTKAALFIAWRYLFSKKKHNIINIISLISAVGIMVSSAALVIVLSVFNGMQDLVVNSLNSFNPDFKITLTEGKSLAVDSFQIGKINSIPEVQNAIPVISDMMLISYDQKQILTHFKGVPTDYPAIAGLDKLIFDGDFLLSNNNQNFAVLGIYTAGILQINLNGFDKLQLYYPKRLKKNFADPTDAFNIQYLNPSGVFMTNTSYDQDFVFIPIQTARELCDYSDEVTQIEVFLKPHAKALNAKKQMAQLLGPDFIIQDQFQQEESLFKTMKSEKLIIFLILSFIVLMAAFNIIGIIGMLIVEKKEDIEVLFTLGATKHFIYKIFIFEGLFVSFVGGVLGIALGFILCLIQQYGHLIKLGGDGTSYIIDYYPVAMNGSDFLLVFVAVMTMSLFASFASLLGLKQRILTFNK